MSLAWEEIWSRYIRPVAMSCLDNAIWESPAVLAMGMGMEGFGYDDLCPSVVLAIA